MRFCVVEGRLSVKERKVDAFTDNTMTCVVTRDSAGAVVSLARPPDTDNR